MLWRAYALLSHGGDRIGLRLPRPQGGRSACGHPDDVLRLLEQTDEAIWAASALAACAESGLLRELATSASIDQIAARLSLPPALISALVDVLESHGLVSRDAAGVCATSALRPFTTPDGAAAFRASLQAPLLQTEDFRRRLAVRDLRLDGWTHTDQEIIEAQGAMTRLWTEKALPKLRYLPGLVARLGRPGAALLDVGAGAAGLSIALCRAFPQLSAVALEPAAHPAAIGERHVRAADLANRIVIRRERVEHLDDREAFDFVFLPQMFLPDAVMAETMKRVFHALRPGGWILVAVLAQEDRSLSSAVNRLKTLLWGGNTRGSAAVKSHLAGAGFDPVIRAPGGGRLRMICARRPNRGVRA